MAAGVVGELDEASEERSLRVPFASPLVAGGAAAFDRSGERLD